MKNNFIKTYMFVVLVMTFSACNVLDQEPVDRIPSADAITDAQSAESALNGLYNSVQSGDLYGGRFILANEMLAGNARSAAFQAYWAELSGGNVPASNFHLQDMWISAYAAINGANSIIAAVPALNDIDPEDSDRILGTAYFFRALMHFDLLRQFGEFFDANSVYGIPLVTEPSLSIKETARSSVSQTYTQIEADLTEAINLLEDDGDKFYVSLGAAQALMARVALYQADYATANTMASAVISNSNYGLPADYNQVYTSEGSLESIFELNFITLADPNAMAIEMYVSPPEVAVSTNLKDFLDNNNEAERGQYFEFLTGYERCTKYGTQREDNGSNVILFRLSEMHLIRAEALARQNGGSPNDALTDLNAVRTRAGQLGYGGLASDGELVDALLAERRAEFAFEGQYWFDLVRLGRMETATGRESFRKVMPIPFRELNISNGTLVQNPGY